MKKKICQYLAQVLPDVSEEELLKTELEEMKNNGENSKKDKNFKPGQIDAAIQWAIDELR